MSKVTLFYVSMLLVFVVGLWATLYVGRSLKAPHDVSGKWVVTNDPANGKVRTLAIAQSGRFLKLRADAGPATDLRLEDDVATASGRRLRFAGGGQTLVVSTVDPPADAPAKPADAEYRFRLTGPLDADVVARREPPADAAKPH